MILTATQLGVDGDMVVKGGEVAVAALMTIEITNALDGGREETAMEWLTRSDVERLRDLCDEALA